MNKQPATYDAQIQKLRERGCEIRDEEFCKRVLSKVNYYRLSAYFLTYKQGDGKYMPGTSFDKAYRIYEFDRKLRSILFAAVEAVEISIRAEIAYFHAHKYGALGYMDAASHNDKHDHERFCKLFEREVSANATALFVKHHQQKYSGDFPIWVAVELFTFGMLSRFYADMKTDGQNAIAGMLSTSVANVKSWLHCCTILRNICAHYGRLYFRTFSAIPANRNLPKLPDDCATDKLFGAVYALRGLFSDKLRWKSEFLPSLSALIDEYSDVIKLSHIGFPGNWKTLLTKQ
jgi:abortive infection bacteriophage resistance protein